MCISWIKKQKIILGSKIESKDGALMFSDIVKEDSRSRLDELVSNVPENLKV